MKSKIFLVIIFILLFTGCNNSAVENNAVAPAISDIQANASYSNHQLWGIWDVNISEDRSDIQVVSLRTADLHINAVKLLEVTPCKTCLRLENLELNGENEISADLTLTHPFPDHIQYTGFDVRAIFISQADYVFTSNSIGVALGDGVPRLLDPDGYTSIFNPVDFPETVPAALGYIKGKYSFGDTSPRHLIRL